MNHCAFSERIFGTKSNKCFLFEQEFIQENNVKIYYKMCNLKFNLKNPFLKTLYNFHLETFN